MSYHRVIGIDLGTTYSAVSVWDNDRQDVVMVPSPVGATTVPSVVGLDAEGKVVVGAPAQYNALAHPEDTIIEVKREMGTYERPPDPAAGLPGIPKRITFRGRQYLPQEISAFILMELKRYAETYIGEPINDAVITVPAYFQEPQKGATKDAAEMARLNVKQLLNEPTSAAVCFGADRVLDGKHLYAVYDLGGGTLDVSIIEVSPGNVSVVGTSGNARLGGADFDERIACWALDEINSRFGVELRGDVNVFARIKREAEMRKRELSVAGATVLSLPFLTANLNVNLVLHRNIFESLIEDLLVSSVGCLEEAIASAGIANGVERSEIEQVLLVGGSTRIPRVRGLLAERLGMDPKDIRSDINPDEVVARGAALVARRFQPSSAEGGRGAGFDAGVGDASPSAAPSLVLQDVTSHTLGVLVNGQDFFPIIMKEARLPASKTQGGFTNGGAAREIRALIFQGEDPLAFKNTYIGEVPILLDQPRERGYYTFEITFELNNDGLLAVIVREARLKKDWHAALRCDLRAGSEGVARSAAHLADALAVGGPIVAESRAASAHTPPLPGGVAAPSSAPPGQFPVAPPPETPDEFKSIARRSLKLLNSPLPKEQRERLLASYNAFVAAVRTGSPEMEDLGDALADTYMECK